MYKNESTVDSVVQIRILRILEKLVLHMKWLEEMCHITFDVNKKLTLIYNSV